MRRLSGDLIKVPYLRSSKDMMILAITFYSTWVKSKKYIKDAKEGYTDDYWLLEVYEDRLAC